MSNSSRNKILICVVGTSPAIITETLFALKDQAPFPTRIMVFTTKHGDKKIKSELVLAQIEQLCHDYKLPIPTLENSDILIPTQSDGNLLDDIRTSVDQEAMADYLMLKIRELCEDDNLIIHASIAGGRKSMSFYMGYIFSFFARPQDSMSHVLIDSQYEKPGFWYPTPNSKLLEGTNLDAKDAKIELAEIPFLRLRDELGLDNHKKDIRFSKMSYRQLLDTYEQSMHPNTIKLRFDTKKWKAYLNSSELELSPEAFALYLLVAKTCKAPCLSIRSPKDDPKDMEKIECLLVTTLAQMCGFQNPGTENIDDYFEFLDDLPDRLEKRGFSRNTRFCDEVKKDGLRYNQLHTLSGQIRSKLQSIALSSVVELFEITSCTCNQESYSDTKARRKTNKNGYLGIIVNPSQIIIE